MAKKNKLSIDFTAFAAQAEKLEKAGGSIDKAVDEMLEKSKDLVNEQLHAVMARKHGGHNPSPTAESIRDRAKVEWDGLKASVDVGFDIANGGLPSIFLMYGTPRHAPNHPGITADKDLYNAVYGASTKRRIQELQEKIFSEAIKKAMGG